MREGRRSNRVAPPPPLPQTLPTSSATNTKRIIFLLFFVAFHGVSVPAVVSVSGYGWPFAGPTSRHRMEPCLRCKCHGSGVCRSAPNGSTEAKCPPFRVAVLRYFGGLPCRPAQPLQFAGDFVRHGAPARHRCASSRWRRDLLHGRNRGASMYCLPPALAFGLFRDKKRLRTLAPCVVVKAFRLQNPFWG